jgi:hypothetical protein
MIEKGIIGLLLGTTPPTLAGAQATAQAAIAAAVGAKVYPAKAPQGAGYPRIVVIKEGAEHQKYSGGRAGLAKTKIRVAVYHQLYGTAEGIAENCRKLLDGYRGALPNSLACQGIFQDDDANQWAPPAHADEIGIEVVELHLSVHANET